MQSAQIRTLLGIKHYQNFAPNIVFGQTSDTQPIMDSRQPADVDQVLESHVGGAVR